MSEPWQKNSTLQEFMNPCELLEWFHKEPPVGITIVYEAEFNYKLNVRRSFKLGQLQPILGVDINCSTLSEEKI